MNVQVGIVSSSIVVSHSLMLSFCVLPGAGPHPKALSGRVILCCWWLFVLVLLACYFSNFNAMLHTKTNKQVHIQSFDDLANQDAIEYGTFGSGSSKAFFKVQLFLGSYSYVIVTVHVQIVQQWFLLMPEVLKSGYSCLRVWLVN